MRVRRRAGQLTFITCGGVHVPPMIDGLVSLGQYMRSMGRNGPFGAGSQLDSLSAPGDSLRGRAGALERQTAP
jgi:hypothetical protein